MGEMKVYLSEKDMYKAWYEEAIARIAELELTISKARMYLAGVLLNAKISPSHDRDFSIINLINNTDDILGEVKHE